jgi:CDP-diacylglycerol--serine O-phosphatidyltransferase
MCNLLCGAIGIERVLNGDIITAFVLVIIAAVLDFFDGFAARMLGVNGDFGKQLDSLADLVTFGVLPGIIFYHYLMLHGYCTAEGFCTSRYAWLALPAGAAWRLALFNIDTRQTTGFIGVPTPITGIAFASLALSQEYLTFLGPGMLHQWYQNFYFLTLAPVLAAWLMVSELPMLALKFKKGDVLNRWKIALLVVCALVFAIFQRDSGIPILLAYVFMSLLANFAANKQPNG